MSNVRRYCFVAQPIDAIKILLGFAENAVENIETKENKQNVWKLWL